MCSGMTGLAYGDNSDRSACSEGCSLIPLLEEVMAVFFDSQSFLNTRSAAGCMSVPRTVLSP